MATPSYGIAFPVRDDEATRMFLTTTTTVGAAVRSNLYLLITTRKGTRWRRPSYGCSQVHRLFEPNDEVTLQEIEEDIRTTVSEWLPGVTIATVRYERTARALTLNVYFEYREGALMRREKLDIPLAGD